MCSFLARIGYAQQSSPIPITKGAEVSSAVKHDVSPPLSHILPVINFGPPQPPQANFLGRPHPTAPSSSPSAGVQPPGGPHVGTTSGLNILGVGQGFPGYGGGVAPSDSNGAVGTTQFVDIVNAAFAVFDKTSGAVLYGPANTNTLWSGFGGGCESNDNGDGTVLFDKVALRWVITQFSVSTTPYLQCVAVSTTSDATGSYYRYSFQEPNFPDYTKLGVWPDAYYASFNMFTSDGSTFLGARTCAFDRKSMLSGAAATQQCFQLSSSIASLLPSDLDGTRLPPAGSPDYYVNLGTNSLNLWQFHVDWGTPANSTLTGPTNIPVNSFSLACGGGVCIPQLGTTQTLDSLGDRVMYRFAYRNYGDHESLVVNHSVTAGTSVGVRWYELRNPGGTPTIYQQGTYAPDASYRWMGSIAMDASGDMALGYSVSSSAMHPGIRYTGRVPGDPLGTMEAENDITDGGGSQTGGLNRWGDYTSMSIDPVDDCTFWYTDQYLQTTGSFNWSTRIASFKFPTCSPPDDLPPSVSITAPANNATVSGTVTVTATASDDDEAVASVQFQLDGTNLGSKLTATPYSISWDTTTASNGSHTLTAIVTDASNNSATSSPVTVTVSNSVSGPPTAGLIGYWNFDEGSGTIAHDTSGSGYNGTVNGATWTAGKINSALSFNGTTNDVVTPGIALGGTFSISAWVNPAVIPEGAYVRIAETQYNGGLYLGTDTSGTKYQFIVNTGLGATGSCGSGFGCALGGTVSSGWHLVTGTFDGTTAKLYVDNAVAGSDTFTAPSSTNYPLYIGRYYGGNGYGWNGVIDEVRLYNRALTAAEVVAIYNYTGN